MTGGFINGIERPGRAFVAHEAITYAGTLVQINSDGEAALCGAGARPDGFVHMGSMTLSTGVVTYAAGEMVAVKGLVNGDVVQIPVCASNIAITVGMEVETGALGCVDGLATTGYVVGVALSAHNQNAGNTTGVYCTVLINRRSPVAA